MSGTTIVGIDPGVHGAIAVLHGFGLVDVLDMPTTTVQVGKRTVQRVSPVLLADALAIYSDTVLCVIEDVHAMPNQGVSSAFGFGRTLGVVEGVVAGLRWPVEMVTPRSWKQAMGVSADKDTARTEAVRMWPGESRWFQRKKDADRAEAALLAMHGRRLLAERSVQR